MHEAFRTSKNDVLLGFSDFDIVRDWCRTANVGDLKRRLGWVESRRSLAQNHQ
jgi:hypothetical protein